jgi:hypothetical protein
MFFFVLISGDNLTTEEHLERREFRNDVLMAQQAEEANQII